MSNEYGNWSVTETDEGIRLDSRSELKGVVISPEDWREIVLNEAAWIKAVELAHARGRGSLNANAVTPDRLVYLDRRRELVRRDL